MHETLRPLPTADYIGELHAQYLAGGLTRHEFLRWGAVLGASLPVLSAWATLPSAALAEGRASAAMTPQKGGVLRCTVPSATQLEPPLLQDVFGAAVVHPVFEQLVRIGPDLVPRPHLAESWTASADAKTWTFKIRKGVTFNNGAAFSADDVIWTFKLLLDPKTASSARSTLSYLQPTGIEKVDAYTVRFHLDRAVSVFPYDINNYMIVMLPKNWPGDFRKNPIGTGPYLLKELVTGDHATYTRNPTYWHKPLPYLDGLRFTFAKSSTSEAASLVAGQSDAMLFTYTSQLPILARSKEVQVLTAHSAAYSPFHMRSDQKPFSDNRVREAFKYMINRDELIKIALHGQGDLGNDHMVAPVFPEFSDNGVRKQDYAKARALLAQAGYPNGFVMDLYGVGPGNSIAPETVALKQMARPANVEIRLRPETISNYYNHWTDVPFGFTGWVGRPTVNAMLNLAYRCGVPWNESHWCDSSFDTLLNQLDATVAMDQRKAIARKIEDHMTTQGPVIIWGFERIFRATRSNVHGLVASPISHTDLDAVWLAT